SAISTAGGRTGRLVNAHLVRRHSPPNLILVATSLRRRCLGGFITSTIWLHNSTGWRFCALQASGESREMAISRTPESPVSSIEGVNQVNSRQVQPGILCDGVRKGRAA